MEKKNQISLMYFFLSILFEFCSYLKQTCQPFKVTKLEILAKSLKKPRDAVKRLDILVGHFFHCDKHKEL